MRPVAEGQIETLLVWLIQPAQMSSPILLRHQSWCGRLNVHIVTTPDRRQILGRWRTAKILALHRQVGALLIGENLARRGGLEPPSYTITPAPKWSGILDELPAPRPTEAEIAEAKRILGVTPMTTKKWLLLRGLDLKYRLWGSTSPRQSGQSIQPFLLSSTGMPFDSRWETRCGRIEGTIPSQLKS
jgi:hypothetical protein